MKQKYAGYVSAYENSAGSDDLSHYAQGLIQRADTENRPIEQSPEKLKNMISHDIRDMLPPQIYELIGLIASALEDVSTK